MKRQDSVTVRVPGSTSNCGSGFDTLGLALRIYNRLTVTRLADAKAPVSAEGADAPARAMVEAAAAAFFQKTGRVPFGFSYRIAGDVPAARGLGSSGAVRAGLVAGLNALAGAGLSARQIIELVTALEGHPDNAAAAVLGGFCVSRTSPVNGATAAPIASLGRRPKSRHGPAPPPTTNGPGPPAKVIGALVLGPAPNTRFIEL